MGKVEDVVDAVEDEKKTKRSRVKAWKTWRRRGSGSRQGNK
jgi:hypothetical protein